MWRRQSQGWPKNRRATSGTFTETTSCGLFLDCTALWRERRQSELCRIFPLRLHQDAKELGFSTTCTGYDNTCKLLSMVRMKGSRSPILDTD